MLLIFFFSVYCILLPSLLGGGMGHFGMFGQGKMGPFSEAYGGGDGRGFGEHEGVRIGPSSHKRPMSSMPPRSW
jgi:hypothetical protein